MTGKQQLILGVAIAVCVLLLLVGVESCSVLTEAEKTKRYEAIAQSGSDEMMEDYLLSQGDVPEAGR